MKIGILSNNKKLYSTGRLKDAARKRGHAVKVIEPNKISIFVERGHPSLYYNGKPLEKLTAIVPRSSAAQSFVATAVVRQFEQMGVFSLNASHAIAIANDKLRTLQILSRHKIGIPPSAFVVNRNDIPAAIEKVGGAPLIIKLISGTQGAGVMLAETKNTAEAILEALQATHQQVLVQKFISESRGRDIRAFVVGNRVVAAMRRIASGDEFRSNFHLGASMEPVELSPDYETTAIHAAHILGLRVAGVDLLESDSGPQVMEVNSSPGLEGIEGTTSVDIADAVIEYLEEQVDIPDVDMRERLSLGRGYGVVEIPISKKSPLAKQSVRSEELSMQEIQVLSIIRGGLTIPNPSLDEKILVGDRLICFGKELALKGLLPERHKKNIRRSHKTAVAAPVEAGADNV